MNSTPLVYLLEEDEDALFRLWEAFQSRHPDWLLYCFTSVPDLLEHVCEDFSKPSLLILSPATDRCAAALIRHIYYNLTGARVVLLTEAGYEGPPVKGVFQKPTHYEAARYLASQIGELLAMLEADNRVDLETTGQIPTGWWGINDGYAGRGNKGYR